MDISAYSDNAVALVENAGDFGVRQYGSVRDHLLHMNVNSWRDGIYSIKAVIEGPDANDFAITTTVPTSLSASLRSTPLNLRYLAKRVGKANATLKIHSSSPDSPFVLPLQGTCTYQFTVKKAGVPNADFTYSPLRVDRQSGLILQKITFRNTTGTRLHGLQLTLSRLADGVQLYSSSSGSMPGSYDVVYSNPVAPSETISFDLVFYDPFRRIAELMQPIITAEALIEAEPDSPPVVGTIVPLLSARMSPQGPLLDWRAEPLANYVVEYTDDAGSTWFSAVHRLSTRSTRMFWIDRGQPETKTKPQGAPAQTGGRQYRVKRL